jgi:L-lactate dehydrogenase
MIQAIQRRTVGIVGTGNVGVAAAYALFNRRVASEIVLIDKDHRRAEGEAMDLMHGQSLVGPVTVRAGSYEDLGDAQVVILSAGVGQRPGETRLDLLNRNAEVFREIARELDRHAPGAILVVATNPVDVLTYVLQELSERPNGRIIGTGTLLDTARFRALLGARYGVDPRSVHAYILGEHGDSEVPLWSDASIGSLRLVDGAVLGRTFDREAMDALFEHVRRAAYEIIERKGYTNLAIGVVLAQLVEAILGDQKSVLPVSVRLEGEYGLTDVCLSIPCVIGCQGVEARVPPAPDESELAGLRRSAGILKDSLAGIRIQ